MLVGGQRCEFQGLAVVHNTTRNMERYLALDGSAKIENKAKNTDYKYKKMDLKPLPSTV